MGIEHDYTQFIQRLQVAHCLPNNTLAFCSSSSTSAARLSLQITFQTAAALVYQ